MASLVYGDGVDPIHIEDRALAHMKIVIATKLRRNESFTLSWKHPEGDPGGAFDDLDSSVDSAPVHFR